MQHPFRRLLGWALTTTYIASLFAAALFHAPGGNCCSESHDAHDSENAIVSVEAACESHSHNAASGPTIAAAPERHDPHCPICHFLGQLASPPHGAVAILAEPLRRECMPHAPPSHVERTLFLHHSRAPPRSA